MSALEKSGRLPASAYRGATMVRPPTNLLLFTLISLLRVLRLRAEGDLSPRTSPSLGQSHKLP